MPVGPLVRSNKATISGIKSDFINTYRKTEPESLAFLKNVMEMINTDERRPRYYYRKSPPLPSHWPAGEPIPTEGMDEESYTLLIRDWGVHIPWHRNDRQDDLTKSLQSAARQAGAGFSKLSMEIFFQIALGSTSSRLLPSIPLAPDGVALASTTDGTGAARFGGTSGNLFTGSGITSTDFYDDFWTAYGDGFSSFKHTDTITPLFEASELQKILVVYSPKNEKAMREAFIQTQRAQIVPGVATAGASTSNIILESGIEITLWSSPYMGTSDKWFMILPDAHLKPIVRAEKESLRSVEYNESTSDITRLQGQEGIVMWQRAGYTVNLPIAFIEVTN